MKLELSTVTMKSTDSQVVVGNDRQESPKKSVKKYIVIAVAGVVVIAGTIAAILVGIHMFYNAQQDLIERTIQLSDGVTQQTTLDPNENVIQLTINDTSGFSQIVEDYNRMAPVHRPISVNCFKYSLDATANYSLESRKSNSIYIRVTRMDRKSGQYCFANALNRTSDTDLTSLLHTPVNVSNAPTIYYVLTPMPIPDVSFLSQKAQDMCRGISIYWVYPSCKKSDSEVSLLGTDNTRLQKRGYDECYWACVLSCFFICSGACMGLALTCI